MDSVPEIFRPEVELNVRLALRKELLHQRGTAFCIPVEAGRLDLTSTYPSLRRHGVPGDFRFTVIHRIFSASSSCPSVGMADIYKIGCILRNLVVVFYVRYDVVILRRLFILEISLSQPARPIPYHHHRTYQTCYDHREPSFMCRR